MKMNAEDLKTIANTIRTLSMDARAEGQFGAPGNANGLRGYRIGAVREGIEA